MDSDDRIIDEEALKQQLLVVFRDEATEELERLASLLRRARGGDPPSAIRDEAMRIAHTVKGGASMVGEVRLASMAHHLEDLLRGWGSGLAELGPERLATSLDECEEAVSAMCALVETLQPTPAGGNAPSAPPDAADGRAREAPPPPTPAPTASQPQAMPSGSPDAHPAQPATEDASAAEAAPHAPPAMPGQGQDSIGRAGGVRVEAERLDIAMGHASDLVTVREEIGAMRSSLDDVRDRLGAMMEQANLAQQPAWRSLMEDFESFLAAERQSFTRLGRVSHEVAEAVRQLRLVPFGALAPSWERTVADAGRHTCKQVRLHVNDAELEIDKQVLDLLRDPVMHLLRNAVDHGIETTDQRVASGKPPEGKITIDASVNDGMLIVDVSDDGAGLDIERIRTTAQTRGIMSAEQAAKASEDELLELLFTSGFSTSDQVTSISGRGVGLDVVRRTAEACRGWVQAIPKCPLGGATMRLAVSVDVLWTRVVLVRSSGTVYAIPTDAVERTVRVAARCLVHSGEMLVLQLDDEQPLRVEALDALMGQGAVRRSGDVTIVVLTSGQRRLGLLVDDVVGAQDVVVRRLPWNVRRVHRVSAGCLLPGGQVAMILDPPRLVISTGAPIAIVDDATKALSKRVLVADDSHTARTLARTALVAAGCEVELAADGNQAWAALQRSEFGLLVSDIQMPGMDGFELTRRVRADPRLSRLPVILVTSRSTREDVERGLAVGADEYIVKGSLQQQQLVEAVARHL